MERQLNIALTLIQNTESNKTVGVFIHDPDSGRVLLKTRPSDSSLMQTFTLWKGKPIIEEMSDTIRGKKVTRRVRVLPTNPHYGKLLMDRFLKRPYRVRSTTRVITDHLDSALDHAYTGYVDQSTAKKKKEDSSPF